MVRSSNFLELGQTLAIDRKMMYSPVWQIWFIQRLSVLGEHTKCFNMNDWSIAKAS